MIVGNECETSAAVQTWVCQTLRNSSRPVLPRRFLLPGAQGDLRITTEQKLTVGSLNRDMVRSGSRSGPSSLNFAFERS